VSYYISKPLKKEKLLNILEDIRAGKNTREITIKERITQEKITQDRIVQEGIVQEGIVQEGIVQEGIVQEGIVQEGIVQEIVSTPPDRETVAFDFPEDRVFNLEEVLERTEGDEVLLKEMVRIFLDMLPELLDSINKAIRKGEAEELRQCAHTLKSAAGSIGANRVFRAAYYLEQIGRENRIELASNKFEEIKDRVEELEPVLIRFLESQTC